MIRNHRTIATLANNNELGNNNTNDNVNNDRHQQQQYSSTGTSSSTATSYVSQQQQEHSYNYYPNQQQKQPPQQPLSSTTIEADPLLLYNHQSPTTATNILQHRRHNTTTTNTSTSSTTEPTTYMYPTTSNRNHPSTPIQTSMYSNHHHHNYTKNATATATASSGSSNMNNNIDTYYYQHNTIITLFWIPCWCCVYLNNNNNNHSNITLFIISCFILYCMDLSNILRSRPILNIYIMYGITILNILYNIYYQIVINNGIILQGYYYDTNSHTTTTSSSSSNDNNMNQYYSTTSIVLQLWCCIGVHTIFYIVTASWYTIQNQWLLVVIQKETTYDNNNNNKNYVSFQYCETFLHSILPPLFAVMMTFTITNYYLTEEYYINDNYDPEIITRAVPYIFSCTMILAMIFIGTCTSSVTIVNNNNNNNIDDNDNNKIKNKTIINKNYCISKRIAIGHILILLIVPCMIHIGNYWNYYQYIFMSNNYNNDGTATPAATTTSSSSNNTNMSLITLHNIMYDFLLVLFIPWLVLVTTIPILHLTNRIQSQYYIVLLGIQRHIRNHNVSSKQQRIQTILDTLYTGCIISFCIQQRYLIPICQYISYHYINNSSSGTIVSNIECTIYWTCSTISIIVLFFLYIDYNNSSSISNNTSLAQPPQQIQEQSTISTIEATTTTAAAEVVETQSSSSSLLFGEYQDDVIQVLLCLLGLCVGKAFGLSWSMIPLPILFILGIMFWFQTRMIRYLFIVLFVIHSVGIITFTYRYVGIDQTMLLPLPIINITLVRFGMLITIASVVIGLITGLAVRSSGGYMASLLRKLDVIGLLTISYSILLLILEVTLLKRPIPVKELSGMDVDDEDIINETLYDVPRVVLTSCIMIMIVLFMKRIRIIHEWSSSVIISISLGKIIAIYTYATQHALGIFGSVGNYNNLYQHSHDPRGTNIIYRTFIAAILCAIMFIPRVFLEPVRLKNIPRNNRRTASNGGVVGATIPSDAIRLIVLYAGGFVPISLMATVPYVVFPLINAVRAQVTQTSYYASSSPPLSELIGSAIALWGLAVISMLNHYLPDGGGEAWKKLAALAFLMGLGIYFVAPTLGFGLASTLYNPYAHMSSVGQQLILRGKSQTAGWGIISAALATLLAVSGPLELKERIYSNGRKDKYLLLRTMIFCFMFGGGVSWLIVLQSMSDSEWIMVLLVVLATLVLAFLGTVATVLGYFLDPDNFDEIEQIATTWCYGLLAFLPITGIPLIMYSGSTRWFGPGGWLAPYLGVGFLSSMAFAVSLRCRQNRNSRTKGLGNTACVVSWLLSNLILYGRYGVGGLDANLEASTIAGIPISVFGTMFLSSILLILDGDISSSRGRGGGRMSVTTSQRNVKAYWRLNFPQLVQSNRWFPLFAGTILIFVLTTLYAILLRGADVLSIFIPSTTPMDEDVFKALHESMGKEGDFLALIVKQAASATIVTSTQLSTTSLWTSNDKLTPILHLVGIAALLPSLVLSYQQNWLNKPVTSNQMTVAAPLHAIPILFCRRIPTLNAAAMLSLGSAVMHLYFRRQSEHEARMHI